MRHSREVGSYPGLTVRVRKDIVRAVGKTKEMQAMRNVKNALGIHQTLQFSLPGC